MKQVGGSSDQTGLFGKPIHLRPKPREGGALVGRQFGEFLVVAQARQIGIALPVLHSAEDGEGGLVQEFSACGQVRLQPVERQLAEALLFLNVQLVGVDTLAAGSEGGGACSVVAGALGQVVQVAWLGIKGPVESLARAGIAFLLMKGEGEVVIRNRVFRIELDGLLKGSDRLLWLLLVNKTDAEVVVEAGVFWVETDGLLKCRHSLRHLFLRTESDRKVIVSDVVFRIEFDSLVVRGNCLR